MFLLHPLGTARPRRLRAYPHQVLGLIRRGRSGTTRRFRAVAGAMVAVACSPPPPRAAGTPRSGRPGRNTQDVDVPGVRPGAERRGRREGPRAGAAEVRAEDGPQGRTGGHPLVGPAEPDHDRRLRPRTRRARHRPHSIRVAPGDGVLPPRNEENPTRIGDRGRFVGAAFTSTGSTGPAFVHPEPKVLPGTTTPPRSPGPVRLAVRDVPRHSREDPARHGRERWRGDQRVGQKRTRQPQQQMLRQRPHEDDHHPGCAHRGAGRTEGWSRGLRDAAAHHKAGRRYAGIVRAPRDDRERGRFRARSRVLAWTRHRGVGTLCRASSESALKPFLLHSDPCQ